MKIIAVTDYKEKVFLGIEQADIIKKRIKENNAWENDYLLGVLWIDNCRYIQLSKMDWFYDRAGNNQTHIAAVELFA